MKKALKITLALLVLAGLALQFVRPVERTNPPVRADFDEEENVERVLRRACYDCHSNETRWPWYAYVAPVSWLVTKDVKEGRDELNFSAWGLIEERERPGFREEVFLEVKAREMPPAVYLLTHANARITPEELELLRVWSEK
jgi:hypothetical protein